jgi:hypothetical protein
MACGAGACASLSAVRTGAARVRLRLWAGQAMWVTTGGASAHLLVPGQDQPLARGTIETNGAARLESVPEQNSSWPGRHVILTTSAPACGRDLSIDQRGS